MPDDDEDFSGEEEDKGVGEYITDGIKKQTSGAAKGALKGLGKAVAKKAAHLPVDIAKFADKKYKAKYARDNMIPLLRKYSYTMAGDEYSVKERFFNGYLPYVCLTKKGMINRLISKDNKGVEMKVLEGKELKISVYDSNLWSYSEDLSEEWDSKFGEGKSKVERVASTAYKEDAKELIEALDRPLE